METDQSTPISRFPREWWLYLRGPGKFLAAKDLTSKGTTTQATKYLLVGIAGMIAFSAVNLKFSSYSESETSKKFFEGTVLTNAVAVNSILIALLSHLLARLVGGRGTIRQTYASFSFMYAFVWPGAAIMLIGIARLFQLLTGIRWSALPPFDVPIEGVLATTPGNILIVALLGTLLLWSIGYLLYCYGCAIQAAHNVGKTRCIAVVMVTLIVVTVFSSPVTRVVYKFTEAVNPLVEWLLKIVL
jgi:hypothetical protein